MYITRDILLNNGFEFRLYDGSTPDSNIGEYVWRQGRKIIRISWGGTFGWRIDINNINDELSFTADNYTNIEVDKVNKAIELCEINFKIEC